MPSQPGRDVKRALFRLLLSLNLLTFYYHAVIPVNFSCSPLDGTFEGCFHQIFIIAYQREKRVPWNDRIVINYIINK